MKNGLAKDIQESIKDPTFQYYYLSKKNNKTLNLVKLKLKKKKRVKVRDS